MTTVNQDVVATDRRRLWRIVVAIGAALVIVGPFFRWVDIELPRLNFHSTMTGLELSHSRGWVLVGCGIGALLVCLLPNATLRNAFALALGAFAGGITFDLLADFLVGEDYTTALGFWMSAFGAGLLTVGAFAGLIMRPSRR